MSMELDEGSPDHGDKDEKYEVMSNVWRRYGLLFREITKNYGYERALQHHIDARKEIDELIIKSLKEKYPNLDLENYGKEFIESNMSSGYVTETEVSENSVKLKFGLCPFYEGFKRAGVCHDVIRETCVRTSRYQNNYFKSHYPEYEGILEVRENADDCCTEGFRITKKVP